VSTPLATPDELGVYLGTAIDDEDPRGTLVLQLAHDLCETVVSPVPALAKGVELAVASRAYNNVTSAHQMSLGSAAVSFGAQNSSMGVGGLYLSKSEKATLRRLAGRSGAFSVNMLLGRAPALVASVSAVYPLGGGDGDVVIFGGYGFTTTAVVTVGDTAAEFEVIDDSLLSVTLPTGSAGDVAVVVTNDEGVSQPYTYTRA
jgi:hypothetical protein